jgi:hypothetical protein
MVENTPLMGHFPTSMHIGASMSTKNISQHESTLRINLTWGLKVLGLYSLVKDLDMAIQK